VNVLTRAKPSTLKTDVCHNGGKFSCRVNSISLLERNSERFLGASLESYRIGTMVNRQQRDCDRGRSCIKESCCCGVFQPPIQFPTDPY
jgi:hypothetical protein